MSAASCAVCASARPRATRCSTICSTTMATSPGTWAMGSTSRRVPGQSPPGQRHYLQRRRGRPLRVRVGRQRLPRQRRVRQLPRADLSARLTRQSPDREHELRLRLEQLVPEGLRRQSPREQYLPGPHRARHRRRKGQCVREQLVRGRDPAVSGLRGESEPHSREQLGHRWIDDERCDLSPLHQLVRKRRVRCPPERLRDADPIRRHAGPSVVEHDRGHDDHPGEGLGRCRLGALGGMVARRHRGELGRRALLPARASGRSICWEAPCSTSSPMPTGMCRIRCSCNTCGPAP